MPLSACFGKSGGRRGAGIRQYPIGVAALPFIREYIFPSVYARRVPRAGGLHFRRMVLPYVGIYLGDPGIQRRVISRVHSVCNEVFLQ
jgi:hypothetical protein